MRMRRSVQFRPQCDNLETKALLSTLAPGPASRVAAVVAPAQFNNGPGDVVERDRFRLRGSETDYELKVKSGQYRFSHDYEMEIDRVRGASNTGPGLTAVDAMDVFFTRLSTPHLQSPNNVPPGCGSIQAECYYSKKYRPLDRKPDECIEPAIRDLKRIGVLREDDKILFRNTMHIEYANVIFDLERAAALDIVHRYLDDLGIAYCGRYGDWAYIWTDESFMSGEKAAEKVLGGA